LPFNNRAGAILIASPGQAPQKELRKALEEARHELVTVSGLYATDCPDLFKFEEHPTTHFKIDTTAAIAEIDADLGAKSNS
jgi:hypothetical protein